jgi:tetratricopeptide (TPR) repeat protein
MDPLLLALARAQDDAERRRVAETHPELKTSAGIRRLVDTVARLAPEGEVPGVMDAALALARALDPADRGEALLAVARLLFRRARYAEAEGLCDEAAGAAGAAGQTAVEVEARLHAIDCCGARGATAAGLARAEALEPRLAGRDRDLALLWAARGHLHLSDSRYAPALMAYDAALGTLAALGDTRRQAEVELRKAIVLQRTGRFDDAEPLLRKVKAAFADAERRQSSTNAGGGSRSGANPALLVAIAASNLGVLSYALGRYGEALAEYEEARVRFQRAGSRAQEAMVLDNIAETYLELNLLEEGRALAARAAEAFQALGLATHQARADMNLARAWLRGAPTSRGEALERLARARSTFLAQGDQVWATLAGLDLARALAVDRPTEALRLARAAELFCREHGLAQHAILARWIDLEARAAASEAAPSAAEYRELAERAEEVGLHDLATRARLTLGALAEAAGHRAEARAEYDRALGWIETTRAALGADEFRAAFLDDKAVVFNRRIEMDLAEAGPDGPFDDLVQSVERARARILLDDLAARDSGLAPRRGLVGGHAGSPAAFALEEQRRRLRERLTAALRRRNPAAGGAGATTATSPSEGASLDGGAAGDPIATIRELETEYVALTRRLQSLDAGRGTPNLPEDIARRLAARLDPDTAFVEFVTLGPDLLALTLYRGAWRVARLGGAAARAAELLADLEDELLGDVAGIDSEAAGGAVVAALARRTERLLVALYHTLLAPVEERLSRARRLVVAPHGALHFTPFAALLSPRGALVDLFELTLAPSGASLLRPRGRRAGGRAVLLSGGTEGVDPAAPAGLSAGLAVPDADRELLDVARRLDRPHFRTGDAPDLAARLGEAPIIHFAGHARLRRDNPLFSTLETGGTPLTLADVLELDLAADLVTLAGCDTASGARRPGDELFGLARAFLHAGAGAVVAALWPVDDRATRQLMARFYEVLRSAPPASALRAAQLDLRNRHPHPYHWAGFVYVGAPDVHRVDAGEGV